MGRILLVLSVSLFITGCASISEEQCLAGNWQELGYKDGSSGASTTRVQKYAEVCTEHGVSVNQDLYLIGYKQGIESYCTDARGFRSGEGGSSFNEACLGFTEYEQAFSEGYVIYQIKSEYASLINEYNDRLDDFYVIEDKLKIDENLSDKERKRLHLKQERIKRELRGLRYDIRDFENTHGFSRTRLDGV